MSENINHPESARPWCVYLCALVALTAVVLLFVMILIFALSALFLSEQNTSFSWIWRPAEGQFGILPMLTGSLLLASGALLFALPFALASVCWILAIGQGKLLRCVNCLIRFMTAIPTVVYAFAAIFLLTPIIRQSFGGTGMGLLTAAIMVGILILPTMILVMVAGLQPKIERYKLCAFALGLNKLELLYFFILPQSGKTILSAALLGFGRATGDTLLPLMLAGNATQVPVAASDSMRSLTAHMALVTANEVGGAAYNSLFIAGFLLLLISAITTMMVKKLIRSENAVHASVFFRDFNTQRKNTK